MKRLQVIELRRTTTEFVIVTVKVPVNATRTEMIEIARAEADEAGWPWGNVKTVIDTTSVHTIAQVED